MIIQAKAALLLTCSFCFPAYGSASPMRSVDSVSDTNVITAYCLKTNINEIEYLTHTLMSCFYCIWSLCLPCMCMCSLTSRVYAFHCLSCMFFNATRNWITLLNIVRIDYVDLIGEAFSSHPSDAAKRRTNFYSDDIMHFHSIHM